MKKERFKLASSGKVAAWMALAFVTFNSAAVGIVADSGLNGPGISQVNKTDIINIVAPNNNGLSHNQYLDFNVDNWGAVFNNSLNGGQSQLVGRLEANSNLNGQAAGVILNEVISRNPSLLLGQQEVFGMAADLILANPNGISCQGCGFINTNNAALVVGNPLIENGMINAYSTLDNYNQLTIGNKGIASGQVLDLVAPAINADGAIRAGTLNAITGNNIVSADMQTITAGKNAVPLDSYYLGGMRAGQIRLVNTAQGSGVKLSGTIGGGNSFNAKAQGALTLTAAQVTGGVINLNGGSLRTEGLLRSTDIQTEDKHSGQVVKNTTNQALYTRSTLDGKNITLVAREEARLTGTDVTGQNVTIQGANVKLDSKRVDESGDRTNDQWKMPKGYNEIHTYERENQQNTALRATGDINITAKTGDIVMSGTAVDAGNHLRADAAGSINLDGAITRYSQFVFGDKSAKMHSNTWGYIISNEQIVKTELNAGGELSINAGRDINTRAAKVQSGQNIILNASNDLRIGVQATKQSQEYANNMTFRLRQNAAIREAIAQGSEFTAAGKFLLSGGNAVVVTGSKVKGAQDSMVQAGRGSLVIENGVNQMSQPIDSRKGGAFNITSDRLLHISNDSSVVRSELTSDANLLLEGGNNIAITGALIESAGMLKINAAGDLNVSAAQAKKQFERIETRLNISDYAKEPKDKPYRFRYTIETTTREAIEHQGSELKGGNVIATAGKNITLTGSSLATTQGNAALSAKNIHLNAANNSDTRVQQKQEMHGEVYFTGGADKTDSELSVGHTYSQQKKKKHQTVTSVTQVQGDLTLTAKNTITQEGVKHSVGGELVVESGVK